MKRSSPIARRTALERRTPVNRRRNKPRRVAVTRDADDRHGEFLRSRPCAIAALHICNGRIEAAHTSNNGRSSKGPDSERVPLCKKAHDEYDGKTKLPGEPMGAPRGHKAFEAYYRIDMAREGRANYMLFEIAQENGDVPQ